VALTINGSRLTISVLMEPRSCFSRKAMMRAYVGRYILPFIDTRCFFRSIATLLASVICFDKRLNALRRFHCSCYYHFKRLARVIRLHKCEVVGFHRLLPHIQEAPVNAEDQHAPLPFLSLGSFDGSPAHDTRVCGPLLAGSRSAAHRT